MNISLPPSGHFRRQLCFLRASLVFFSAWALLEPAFSEYPHLTLLLAGGFGLAFLFPRRLSGRAEIWTPRLGWALGPPWALLVVELLNNTDPFEALTVMQCILNLIWYYLFFALLALLFGRIRRAAALGMLLCFAGRPLQTTMSSPSAAHHLPDRPCRMAHRAQRRGRLRLHPG